MMSSEIEMPIDDETGKHVNIGWPTTAEQSRPIVEAVRECGGDTFAPTWTCTERHYRTHIGCVAVDVYKRALELCPTTVAENNDMMDALLRPLLRQVPNERDAKVATLRRLIEVATGELLNTPHAARTKQDLEAVLCDQLLGRVLDKTYDKACERGRKMSL